MSVYEKEDSRSTGMRFACDFHAANLCFVGIPRASRAGFITASLSTNQLLFGNRNFGQWGIIEEPLVQIAGPYSSRLTTGENLGADEKDDWLDFYN